MVAVSLFIFASSGCAKQQEESNEQRLSRANDAFAAGRYDKAEKDYREVLRLNPNDAIAIRQLGLLYQEQGEFVQSFPLLKKAAELEPDNVDVQFKFGVVLLAVREFSQARDAALQVLEKKPGDEQALTLLADTAVALNDVEETRKTIESLRERDQDRPGFHLGLGLLKLRQRDWAGAESEFKAALEKDAKSVAAYTALANVYLSRNEVQAADQAFKTAADLSPTRSPIRVLYADFKARTGAIAEAKKMLEDINRDNPDYLPARVQLMRIACAQTQDDDCAARVQSVLAQDPINYDAVFQSGMLSLAKGNATEGVRAFSQLGNIYRQDPQIQFQLARAYLLYSQTASLANSRDAIESAESSLNEAIKLTPNFDQATVLLAELKLAKKQNPAAAADLLQPLVKERRPIARAYLLLATAYLAQQRKDDALAVYRQMAELFPRNPQASFLIGTVLLQRGDKDEARKAFEKSIEISPTFLPSMEQLVNLDLVDNQYSTATARVQNHIEQDAKNAQLWAIKGKIELAQQDFAHAEPDLLKAIELDPKLEGAHLLLAQLYVASNKTDQAIEELSTFVENNKSVPALMQLALIQQNRKDFRAASDTYEKALAINPDNAVAANNLADLYSEHLGRLDAAYNLASKARQLMPNEPHAADTLGWILFKRNNYADALRFLQESAGKLPDDPNIQFHLGMAQYMLGEREPARVALQKAVESTKDFADKDEARKRLAVLAINPESANADARTHLDNYLRERPNDPEALVRFAQFQERDGAVDQAIKTYEKIVDGYPLFGPALHRLAILYGQRSTNNPKAHDIATSARQKYPDDPEVAKTLGILTYRRGNYPQAANLLKEAAAKRSDDSELLFYLGETYYQLKELRECKDMLQRALSLNLPAALIGDARRALAECSETSPL